MVFVVVVVVVILFIKMMTVMLRFCGLFFEAHSFSEYSASKSRMRDET
jgi:hypothetical protein